MQQPPPSRWRLDELSSAGRENLDAAHAARYDSKEDAGAASEVALLERLGLNATSTVIDLGAGTGQFTLAVALRCGSVTAVDVSTPMLDVLRAKLAATDFSNVRIEQAGFLTYTTPAPADFVYTRWALHHLPDFWKAVALDRMHAMLRPGGVLRLCDIVYNFAPADAQARIDAWCASYAGNGWHTDELEEHVRDEHSTFTWLLEPMLQRCGFAIEIADYSDDGFFANYVARRV